MIFIGFATALKNKDISNATNTIINLCSAFGYKPIINQLNIDKDMEEGITLLRNKKSINFFVYLNKSSTKSVRISSSGITEEIDNISSSREKPAFYDFVRQLELLLPTEKLYFIFGVEWNNQTRVRFKSGSGEDLINFLTENEGWYLRLYDIKTDSFTLELDIPLVFEVKILND